MAVPPEVAERAAGLHPEPTHKRPVFADRAPSEDFVASFSGGGSNVIECGFCGRLSVGTGGDFEPGEREGYEARAAQDPDAYIFQDYDFVSNFELDGKVFVVDCRCNAATRYERLVWTHRDEIMGYFRAVSRRKTKEAQRLADSVASTAPSAEGGSR